MFEDAAAQMKVFLSLMGASLAAWIASLARNVYHADGFSWKRTLWDLPFAVTCALVAGSLGAWLALDAVVVYGIAGAFAYLGPQWLDGWLRRKAETAGEAETDGKDGDVNHGAQ